jgi:L-lactate dehydrogenase complex protein LldG
MVSELETRATAVGAEIHHLQDRRAAFSFITHLLHDLGVAAAPGYRAVWAPSPGVGPQDETALIAEVPGLTFDVTRDAAAEALVGISQMDWAIAATGTLAQAAAAVEQRLVSTLPRVHVALLDSRRVVPTLGALLAKLGPRDTRYLALITGPSRTADIERVLTIGVHGPGRLVVLLVDDLGGES